MNSIQVWLFGIQNGLSILLLKLVFLEIWHWFLKTWHFLKFMQQYMSPVSPLFHIVSTVNSWSQICVYLLFTSHGTIAFIKINICRKSSLVCADVRLNSRVYEKAKGHLGHQETRDYWKYSWIRTSMHWLALLVDQVYLCVAIYSK